MTGERQAPKRFPLAETRARILIANVGTQEEADVLIGAVGQGRRWGKFNVSAVPKEWRIEVWAESDLPRHDDEAKDSVIRKLAEAVILFEKFAPKMDPFPPN